MRRRQRQFLRLAIVIMLGLAVFCIGVLQDNLHAEENLSLPPAQAHPLPPALAQWTDSKGQGDYFDQVRKVKAGFLVWSHFPIKVYIAPPPSGNVNQTRGLANCDRSIRPRLATLSTLGDYSV